MIAIFIGVLELVKVRRILIDESDDGYDSENTRFIINTDEADIAEASGENYN